MSDTTLSLVRRYVEAWQQGPDSPVIDEITSPDFVGHDPLGRPISGPDGMRGLIREIHTAFPDVRLEAVESFAISDRGVLRFRLTGTHQGDFMGIAPTNKPVTLEGAEVIHVRDGKVTEAWCYGNTLGVMQQLGVVPSEVAVPTAA